MIIAAYCALGLLGALSIFQLALLVGAPLGRFAWGGAHRVLPVKLRAGSGFALLLYALFAALITSASGLWVVIDQPTIVAVGLWVTAAYMTLGVAMNAISRSKPERFVMTPTAFVLAVCFYVLALS